MSMTNLSEQRLLLTPEEAATALNCGRTFVFDLMRTGALRSVKLGRLRRIPRSEVERFTAALLNQERERAEGGPVGRVAEGRRSLDDSRR